MTKRLIAALCLYSLLVAGAAGCRQAKPGADPGPLLIRKYPGNYTAFKMSLAKGPVVVFDPYALDEDVVADFVSVSHPHEDHMDVSRIAGTRGAKAVVKPGAMAGKGARFAGYEGVHNKGDEGVTNVMRLLEMGGFRILHLGSQAEPLAPELIAAIGKVDVLVVQVFPPGGDKLDAGEAAAIAKSLGARFIVPAHGDPGQSEALAKSLGARVERYAEERASLARSALDAAGPPVLALMDN
jgi:L-ascorbate metabolism protein UlaG (beta-lactamase superfamily)